MRLVVIGASAAGLSAAARARRCDRSIAVTVLEKSNVVSLGLCGLPYFVEGRVASWRQLLARPPEYFEKLGIEVRTGAEVVAIEHARRRVRMGSGEAVGYDKLVYAVGARAAPGPEGSFSMATLEGAVRLREYLDGNAPGRAVIAGGGYIGLEAAEALRSRGWRVRVAHAGADLLDREDAWLTETLVKHLNRFRVEVGLGTRVDTAPDGELLVWAGGLRPNVEMAAEAGVELGRTGAIRADERMETNLGSLLAAGDCMETVNRVTGGAVWAPLGTTANKMGRVAGAVAAGQRERFPGITGTSIVRVCGLGVAMTGLSEVQARREGMDAAGITIEANDRAGYFRARPVTVQLVGERRTGRLIGGVVLGESGVEGRINVIATALAGRLEVEELAGADLAYAPPFAPVWDPVLIAARELLKLLH